MAEAMARQLFGGAMHVESAGVAANGGTRATRDAVQVMKERGLDLSTHRSRPLSAADWLHFDLLIALTPEIAQTLREQGADAAKLKTLDIPDPYGKDIDTYRATAAAIEHELLRLFGRSPKPRRGGNRLGKPAEGDDRTT